VSTLYRQFICTNVPTAT